MVIDRAGTLELLIDPMRIEDVPVIEPLEPLLHDLAAREAGHDERNPALRRDAQSTVEQSLEAALAGAAVPVDALVQGGPEGFRPEGNMRRAQGAGDALDIGKGALRDETVVEGQREDGESRL